MNDTDLVDCIRLNITEESLSPKFKNEIVENGDLIIIRSNLKTMADINEWMKEFGIRTKTKWNTRKTCPTGERFVCWKKFVCHHSSFNKALFPKNTKAISKNAKCLASVTVKIKLDNMSTRKNDDFIRRGLVGVITMTPFHQHNLMTAETLRFLPATDCREQFEEYFNDGMGPAESSKYHREILEMNPAFQPSDLANGRINPTKRTITYWHEQWRLLHLGARNGHGMIEKLKEKIATYSKCNVTVAYKEDPFAVAVLTPIMKRAHNLRESEETIFIDSTSSCDAENHSITFMLTPCAAGAVPIGIFITKGQTEESYKQGFDLIVDTLKEAAFNYKESPAIVITDDSDAEINALKKTWPRSKHFLCIFHVGQAIWRWLWESKNGIPKDSRRQLMFYFQQILYAETPACAHEAYLNAIGYIGSCLPTYPLWNDYLTNMWKRKELWCLAFRDESIRGHNTNNFSEVAIRIFKDEVLSRVRAYNVVTLIDFISTTLEKYYSRRLQEFANSRNASPRLFLEKMRKKALESENPINPENIKRSTSNSNEFSVLSEKEIYFVDTLSACCSCSVGRLGRFCKHQFSVYYYYNVCGQNFPAVGAKDKHQIAVLALGQEAPSLEFYQPFRLVTCDLPSDDISVDRITPSTSKICLATASLPPEDSVQIQGNCNKKEVRENLIKAFIDSVEKFDPSVPAMEKALIRLKKLSSEGQCETMLATLGSNVPLKKKAGVSIRVQPTSIARRTMGVTRGSKRLACGRPSDGSQTSKRRKHNLSVNVKAESTKR